MGARGEIEFVNWRNRADFEHCDLLIHLFKLIFCSKLLSLSEHIELRETTFVIKDCSILIYGYIHVCREESTPGI